MEIASKDLGSNQVNKQIVIDDKIIIDLKNKSVIVMGKTRLSYPDGEVIKEELFRYEIDNIPAIEEVKDSEGNVVRSAVEANPRFDNLAASEVGKAIINMVSERINNL